MIPTILLQAPATATAMLTAMPEILKAYLIICALLLPFNVAMQTVFLLHLTRKGTGEAPQPSDLTGMLSRLLPSLTKAARERRAGTGPASVQTDGPAAEEPAAAADSAAPEDGAEKTGEPAAAPVTAVSAGKRTIYEENAEAGIVNILLRTGDVYRCFMSEDNRGESREGWKLDYPFIGRLSQNGRFEALRAGTTYIQGGNGRDIYYMEITPRHSLWPYSLQMSDITNRSIADEIRTRRATGDEVLEDSGARTLTVRDGSMTTTYRFDQTGRADLVLVRLADTEEETRIIEEGLADYMELTVQKGRSTYWHHRTTGRPGTPYADSVDTVAFVKHTARGVLYLGIGRCWRPGAGSGEIRTNTDMLEATFGGLMDPADVPQYIGRQGTAQRATPPMAVTAAVQEAASEESGQQTADGVTGKKKRQRKSAGSGRPGKAKRKDERPADGIDPMGAFPDDGMNDEPGSYDEEA